MSKNVKTKRIYFGEAGDAKGQYWQVRISNAKEPVTINGHTMHALKGRPGVTLGCALSWMAMDRENENSFPHPVFLAAFNKSTCTIVDKLNKGGQPTHAVVYAHSYGKYVDLNDLGTLKEMVKIDPSIIEKEFILRAPRKRNIPGSHSSKAASTGVVHSKRSFVHRGALARAVKAGLISKNYAAVIKEREQA